MAVCALCARRHTVREPGKGLEIETHKESQTQRHRSSLMQECPKNAPFIVCRVSSYRDSHARAKRTKNNSPAIRNS